MDLSVAAGGGAATLALSAMFTSTSSTTTRWRTVRTMPRIRAVLLDDDIADALEAQACAGSPAPCFSPTMPLLRATFSRAITALPAPAA